MIDHGDFRFNPDMGLDAELTGFEMAGAFTDAVSAKLAEDLGRELCTDERAEVQNLMAPGFAHFRSVAEQAGELAGEGDIQGAISLMGGIENSRELLGDEIVDDLLAQVEGDANNSLKNL